MSNKINEVVYRANKLAEKCVAENKLDEAAKLYAKSLNINPKNESAIAGLSSIYINAKRYDLAERILKGAIKLLPDNAIFYLNLGVLYIRANHREKALDCLLKSYELDKSIKQVYVNLSSEYLKYYNYSEALKISYEGLERFPNYPELHNNVGFSLRGLGRYEDSLEFQKSTLEKSPKEFRFFSNYLFYLSQWDKVTPKKYLEEAKVFGKRVSSGVIKYNKWPKLEENKKLRIGFVSGDFRDHPVTYFIENWLALFDEYDFEIVGYYTHTVVDEKTKWLSSIFDEWFPVDHMSDVKLARKIYDDRINILIDLSGHTAHNRLPAFAFKPSPIQISWIGFPATTGMEQIDYLMPNKVMSPPEFEPHYVEKVWYLESAGCLKPPEFNINVNDLPCLKNGYITFGSFHNIIKLTDVVLETWSEILKRVPNSKILCKSKELTEVETQKNLIDRFDEYGITSDRLIIEGVSPFAEYLSTFNKVDIGLDPFPYNAGTVGYHSLWMGVPYVALKGDRVLSRIGCSNLSLVNLDHLIADSLENYVETAVSLASDENRLAEIRAGLRERALESGLYNGAKMAQSLSAAFKDMWQLYLKNNK